MSFILSRDLSAQDAVPGEILKRTLLIRVGEDRIGTAFKIDRSGKLYLVTARHMVAGLPVVDAIIHVWRDNKWDDLKTVKTMFPLSNDADIAVLETQEKVEQPFAIQPATGTEGPTFGQQVWFLGYPTALGAALPKLQFPFIKRGTMSAIDSSDRNAVVFYIDGFNNPGFSGGPIIYWDFSSHAIRILGVVQGFRTELANGKSMVNGQAIDTAVLVNSGILVGYSINHAIQAIESGDRKP